jgi:PAS domain S-box-containing protein
MDSDAIAKDLDARLDYLEEIHRFTVDALEMAASLGDFQSSINKLHAPSAVLKETGARVKRLIPFQDIGFYLVDEENSDFHLVDFDPECDRESLAEEVEFLIANGTFAWALRENRPIRVSTRDFQRQVILHVMATRSRIRGLFAGILPPGEKDIPEVSLSLLSIILLSSANALESYELYRMVQNARRELEDRVKERTMKLVEANEKLQIEMADHRRSERALRVSEEQANQLAQENAIMAEIGRIISSTLNIDEVYEGFAEEARKLIFFDRISINIFDPEAKTGTVAYSTGTVVPGHQVGDIFPLTGSGAEETMQTRSGFLFHPEDGAEVEKRFPGLLHSFQAGYRSMIIVPLVSKDKVIGSLCFESTRPTAFTVRALKLAENIGAQIAGAIANAQLFTERKQMEEALRKSEEKFRDLFDNAPVGYYELDIHGRFTNLNQTELAMMGYRFEEMIGQPVWKFNGDEEAARKRVLGKLAGVLPLAKGSEFTYRRKDGTTFPVLIEDRLLRDKAGTISGVRGTIQDITDPKKAEQEVELLQEQLRQAQKMEAIGHLAGGIAHDFNNILTVIKGRSELALFKLPAGDPLRGDIEEIKWASVRAASLTQQLLAFSRRQILEFKVLDLNAVLLDLDTMLRRVIGEDIDLVTVLGEDLGKVKSDPSQIEQVILNLVVNARDAMPGGGKLILETANVELDEDYVRAHVAVTPGSYVRLSVSDTGVGMSPELKKRIFEPFFTTKESGKGTGLGLSMVYGIVKQTGGNIWVYSEPGQGTVFKIYLPRVDEPVDRPDESFRFEEAPRGRESILLVEDEEAVRELAAEFLRNQGYAVVEASQGDEAFLVCGMHKGAIDLMVTDVVMPGMSGRELAGQLGSLRPGMKVLYMSGYTDDSIVRHGVLEKGVNFIQKPFSMVRLAQKVREVLDKNANPAG